jgi:hypothetical protein
MDTNRDSRSPPNPAHQQSKAHVHFVGSRLANWMTDVGAKPPILSFSTCGRFAIIDVDVRSLAGRQARPRARRYPRVDSVALELGGGGEDAKEELAGGGR